MTRKELNEIKSQYTLEDCGILRLCGCYVDGERNKITQFNENFLNLPEEEKHKYFDIFKKTLSGTPGKNLVDMKFNVDAYADEGARTFLMNLRDSGLKDDRLLDEFYDRIINNYSYVGNYLILLINQMYDIPALFNVPETGLVGLPDDKTTTMAMYIMRLYNSDVGKAAAVSVVLFIITLVVSLILFATMSDSEDRRMKKEQKQRRKAGGRS